MFDEINNIHPNIKFTMAHTSNIDEPESESCDCPKTDSVPYLDPLRTIREGNIILGNCHPAHCVENIPFSLAL